MNLAEIRRGSAFRAEINALDLTSKTPLDLAPKVGVDGQQLADALVNPSVQAVLNSRGCGKSEPMRNSVSHISPLPDFAPDRLKFPDVEDESRRQSSMQINLNPFLDTSVNDLNPVSDGSEPEILGKISDDNLPKQSDSSPARRMSKGRDSQVEQKNKNLKI